MIILASNSPRRKELLQMMNIPFKVHVSSVDESKYSTPSLRDLPLLLSQQKAQSVALLYPSDTIIGADTVVLLNNQILEKPVDDQDCYRILRLLSNKTHEVITAVTIVHNGKTKSFTSSSLVTFYPLTDDDIYRYIESKEPYDKAGAYAIQGLGAKLIKEIHGDFYTIMGLPIAQLYWELKQLHIL